MIQNFIENTKGLTKNPLGIIALFISLIYGFACLVLSSSISNLEGYNERLPLIWFIILFPIIVLIVFVYLVMYHHEKLYAPSDYKDDSSFMDTISKESIYKKQEKEIEYLETAKDVDSIKNTKEESVRQSSKQQFTPMIDRKELFNIYTNSEKWIVKEISLKYNVMLKQNVSYNTSKGRIELDAVGTLNDVTYIIEIKYWQVNKSFKNLENAVEKFLSQTSLINYGQKVQFIIALVFDNLEKVNQKDFFDFVKTRNNDAIIEFFDYEKLKIKHQNQ